MTTATRNLRTMDKIPDSYPHSIRWLSVNILQSDSAYQRRVSETKVRAISKAFDMSKLGCLVVSQRHNGYWLVDGQHRMIAARKCGISHVPCDVRTGLTPQTEANLRLGLHNRKQDNPIERFRLELAEGNPVALAINSHVRQAGLKVHLDDTGRRDPQLLRCIGNLHRIYTHYRDGPDLLRRTLTINYQAWPTDYKGRAGRIIRALGLFLHYYPEASDAELIARLQEYEPQILQRRISAEIEASPASRDIAMGRIILRLYNHRRRKRLPDRFVQDN